MSTRPGPQGSCRATKASRFPRSRKAALHSRKNDVPIDQPLEGVEIAADLLAFDRRHQAVGVEPGIPADVDAESLISSCRRRLFDGAPMILNCRIVAGQAIGADMADGAVQPDAFDT